MPNDLTKKAFLAFPNQMMFLEDELLNRFQIDAKNAKKFGDLLYFDEFPQNLPNPYFAKSALLNPDFAKIESIGSAATFLRSIQRNWASYDYQFFRRSALLQEKLPFIHKKARFFPFEIPSSAMGFFSLVSKDEMIFASQTSSPFPAGNVFLAEDHENPPSRAYLKLEEALIQAQTLFDFPLPSPSSKCFEAGACPGGWTWVLRELGAEVLAVDRAELAPKLMQDSRVKFRAHDAFTLTTDEVCEILQAEKIDFLLSDVICYPARLLEWILRWIESGRAEKIICTIKMQGKIDWNLIEEFAKLNGAHIRHLNHNKHELTFFWQKSN